MQYLDGIIRRRVCPTASQHYGLRRFVRKLPTRGYMTPTKAVLIVENKQDPCRTYVIVEDLRDEFLQTVSREVAGWWENHKPIDN